LQREGEEVGGGEEVVLLTVERRWRLGWKTGFEDELVYWWRGWKKKKRNGSWRGCGEEEDEGSRRGGDRVRWRILLRCCRTLAGGGGK